MYGFKSLYDINSARIEILLKAYEIKYVENILQSDAFVLSTLQKKNCFTKTSTRKWNTPTEYVWENIDEKLNFTWFLY